jgi:hypothetical protein
VPATELGSFLIDHKESIYRSHKREPLGQGYNRGHILPPHTQADQFRFGKQSASSIIHHFLTPATEWIITELSYHII